MDPLAPLVALTAHIDDLEPRVLQLEDPLHNTAGAEPSLKDVVLVGCEVRLTNALHILKQIGCGVQHLDA